MTPADLAVGPKPRAQVFGPPFEVGFAHGGPSRRSDARAAQSLHVPDPGFQHPPGSRTPPRTLRPRPAVFCSDSPPRPTGRGISARARGRLRRWLLLAQLPDTCHGTEG